MDARMKVEVNGAETYVEISPRAIEADTFCIRYDDIKSLHTKNEGAYLLKIVDAALTYIFKFPTIHVRDLVKNVVLSCKSRDADSELRVFIQFPLLLKIFEELDVSQSQFLNYYRSSFFYNIKNEKNCIDRLLGKSMGFSCNNFASRINNISLLSMQSQKDIDLVPKGFSEKAVDFEPIYPKTVLIERKKLTDFDFADFKTLSFDVVLEIEESKTSMDFDRSDLEMLRELRKSGAKADKEIVERLTKRYGAGSMHLLKRIMPEQEDTP